LEGWELLLTVAKICCPSNKFGASDFEKRSYILLLTSSHSTPYSAPKKTMTSAPSKAALNTLSGSDGSATYSSNGYTVIAAVNGPIEVSRRDEMPEEATLEVNIRPAVGVGGKTGSKIPFRGSQLTQDLRPTRSSS
jgi:hypothetical protein